MAEEPIVALVGPYQVDLLACTPYFSCLCGCALQQPLRRSRQIGAETKPKGFDVNADPYYVCGCQQTDDEPFCDGSHLLL